MKTNKHKSRNNFSDVQRIELNPATPPVTTMDLIRESADLTELSEKLDQRLLIGKPAVSANVAENGSSEQSEEKKKLTVEGPNVGHVEPMDDSPSNHNIIYAKEAQNQVVEVVESGIESEGPSASSPSTTSVDVTSPQSTSSAAGVPKIEYHEYKSELQMPDIIRLIQRDLSEPYSIYTYRYFIHNWPQLCFLAMHGNQCVGAIVCKLGLHRQIMKRGYIAMLAVDKEYRKLKIGSNLVQKAIEAMLKEQADEVVLETEITNTPALRLYENLGFVRDKRLFQYYLNGVDALRLKLWFR